MTVPGFVQLGVVAVLFQLSIIGGFYGYLRRRRPVEDPVARRRTNGILFGGTGLVALGQLAALGSVGATWVVPYLSFSDALVVQNAGLFVAAVGYVGVFGGFVVHARAND